MPKPSSKPQGCLMSKIDENARKAAYAGFERLYFAIQRLDGKALQMGAEGDFSLEACIDSALHAYLAARQPEATQQPVGCREMFETWWKTQFTGIIGRIQEQVNLRQGTYEWALAAWEEAWKVTPTMRESSAEAELQRIRGFLLMYLDHGKYKDDPDTRKLLTQFAYPEGHHGS
jgi:hypothetical protein